MARRDRGLAVLFLLLVFGTPFLFLVVVLLLDHGRDDGSSREPDAWGGVGRDRPGGGPSYGPLG